jgi:hypothetical protein
MDAIISEDPIPTGSTAGRQITSHGVGRLVDGMGEIPAVEVARRSGLPLAAHQINT